MKTMNMKLKLRTARVAPPSLAVASLLLASGCAHQTARREKASRFLAEESRVLTTAIVETLTEQPTARRDAYTATALLLARQDQRLEGLPIAPIQVEPLISSNTAALSALTNRFDAQNQAVETRADASERLARLGELKEIELNAQRRRWLKWGSTFTLVIGGLAALCVFCPMVLPILGRLLGWIASRVPSWAGALGVVSVKAFDAVVRGVEKTRRNAANTADPAATIGALETNLAVEMDAEHKALVRSRKEALPL